MNRKQPKFTWGQAVRVKDNAPELARRDTVASVCGITIHTEEIVYLVEFGDGEAFQINEAFLHP